MARFAALLLVALVAGAFVSQAAAMVKLCDNKATPATPNNVQVVSNKPGPKGAEITLVWNTGIKETTGCVDFWRVITNINGKDVAEDGVPSTSPGQPTATTVRVHKAGDMVSFKVYAMRKGDQKKSGIAGTPSAVRAATAGATTGRKML